MSSNKLEIRETLFYSKRLASVDNLRPVKPDLVWGDAGLSKVKMNGRRWVNPHRRRTAARAGASGAPGLRVSGQRAPTGKCLFSLLNLSNANTVNFISEGRLPWIIYEPPVSIPKPPLCLPACVFAHTSSRVLVNQHIVKCLCMQRGGGGGEGGGGGYWYTHLSLSRLY